MGGTNMPSMRRFHHLHAQIRVFVGNGFGRLKGRWHVLRIIYAHPYLDSQVQEVCVVLPNFLEERDGGYDDASELEEHVPTESSLRADGDIAPTSPGVVGRIQILKALGLPWVD